MRLSKRVTALCQRSRPGLPGCPFVRTLDRRPTLSFAKFDTGKTRTEIPGILDFFYALAHKEIANVACDGFLIPLGADTSFLSLPASSANLPAEFLFSCERKHPMPIGTVKFFNTDKG